MSKPLFDRSLWEKYVQGWEITDCALREHSVVYICLRKSLPDEESSRLFDSQIPSRMLAIKLAQGADLKVGSVYFEGYSRPVVGAVRKPIPQGLMGSNSIGGAIYAIGSGSKPAEELLTPDSFPFLNRIKNVLGRAYAVCGFREIHVRINLGEWKKIHDFPSEGDVFELGFEDMDAFSEDDMYAVGGHGDVWHFDGNDWQKMGFPSNATLGTVTCAGDGNVYISGEGGTLWVGEKSTWRRVYEGHSSILWNDVLWFQDKLWLASDYQLKTWDGKQMSDVVEEDGKLLPVLGHMDVQDGLLAIASPFSMFTYDGQTWRSIIAPYID